MPVSMMMPMVGSRPKVSGSSSVMPASGPSPGSTPTTVPHRQPMKQYSRPFQDKAIEKPRTSCSKPVIENLQNGNLQNGPIGSRTPSSSPNRYQHAAKPTAEQAIARSTETRAMNTSSTALIRPSV